MEIKERLQEVESVVEEQSKSWFFNEHAIWMIEQIKQQQLEINQLEHRLENNAFFDTAHEPTPKKVFKL